MKYLSKRRLAAVLLAACMCMTAVPVQVLAEEQLAEDIAAETAMDETAVAEETEEIVVEESADEVIQEEVIDAEDAEAEEEIVEDPADELLAAGNSFSEAQLIKAGTTYTGNITSTNTVDYYKISLSQSSYVHFESQANIEYVYQKAYYANGETIWSVNNRWNTNTKLSTAEKEMYLTAGIYYLGFEKDGSCYGEYSFSIDITSSKETFVEKTGGSNNTLATAETLNLGTSYAGQISMNDTVDYYKFTISSSGTVSLNISESIEYVYNRIYNADGVKLWESNNRWNTNTKLCVTQKDVQLTKGTYYFGIERDGSRYGTYNFDITFSSADETFAETGTGTNNSLATAETIALATTYRGQIAYNDESDFYQLTLPSSGKLRIHARAGIEYVNYYLYDKDGKQIWSAAPHWNTNTYVSDQDTYLDLTKGTYYFSVNKNGSRYGNYYFKLGFTTAQESFEETGTGINNETASASRISINKSYKGQIALNDTKDYYRFSVSKDATYHVYLNAAMNRCYLHIYKSNGEEAWSNGFYANSTTNKVVTTENIDLAKGSYYLLVEDSSSTGNYTFAVQTSYIDKLVKVSKIANKGTGIKIVWNGAGGSKGYYIYRKVKGGSYKRIAKVDASTRSYIDTAVKNKSGETYYYVVRGYSGDVKTRYKAKGLLRLASPAIELTTSSAYNKIEWNQISGAEGYYIYRKTDGVSYQRIANIKSGTTIKYADRNVNANTRYTYAVRAYSGTTKSSYVEKIIVR